jgi:hypothetical protein
MELQCMCGIGLRNESTCSFNFIFKCLYCVTELNKDLAAEYRPRGICGTGGWYFVPDGVEGHPSIKRGGRTYGENGFHADV